MGNGVGKRRRENGGGAARQGRVTVLRDSSAESVGTAESPHA